MGYARKDVEKTKKMAKKFVRYQEGAELDREYETFSVKSCLKGSSMIK